MKASRVFTMVAVVTAFALVLASPLVMQWYGDTSRLQWSDLADIGQAFGFVSAIFSALAFAAVAWSIKLQANQIQAQRLENLRRTHIDVVSLALNDPYILACLPMQRDEIGKQKRYHYLNLLMWWWHYNFSVGLATEGDLRLEASDLFRGEAGRQYLLAQRKFRLAAPDEASERFFKIIDEEFDKAERSGPPIPFAFDDDSLSNTPSRRGGLTGSVLLVGVALGAGWVLGRSSSGRRT